MLLTHPGEQVSGLLSWSVLGDLHLLKHVHDVGVNAMWCGW